MRTATVQCPIRTAARFRNILFATDFSPAAAGAIPFVKRIARHFDANVVALHVRPPVIDSMTPPFVWVPEMENARVQDAKHCKELLDCFAGIPTRVLIEEGGIHSRLEEAIEREKIDLLVMGTRGRGGLAKLLLGSVAEEVFRSTTCPVLTVGPLSDVSRGPNGEIREILYATDFTPESKAASAYALSVAEEFQANIVLLHVVAKETAGDLVAAREVSDAARKLLHNLVPEGAEEWCMPKYIVGRGDVAEQILEIAKLRESDLIVLGTKQEKGYAGVATHLPMGIAHKVVTRATCPVLTVRS